MDKEEIYKMAIELIEQATHNFKKGNHEKADECMKTALDILLDLKCDVTCGVKCKRCSSLDRAIKISKDLNLLK